MIATVQMVGISQWRKEVKVLLLQNLNSTQGTRGQAKTNTPDMKMGVSALRKTVHGHEKVRVLFHMEWSDRPSDKVIC